MYSTENIIRVIRSRRMGWVRHILCMGEMKDVYGLSIGKSHGKRT
jgi:hypothetical protein